MERSVLTSSLPRAGTTQSYADARSYPAAPSLPRTGRVACSLIFLTRSRSAILVMSVLGFLFASYWEFSLVDMQRTGKRRTAWVL